MSDNSIIPSKIYKPFGDIKQLAYDRSRTVVDLNPFLQDVFEGRDRVLGKPDFKRFETNGDVTTYFFRMQEFFQAFMPKYGVDNVNNFFTQHLSTDELQSESFLTMIGKFSEDYYKVLFGDSRYTKKGNVTLFPLNLPRKELSTLLRTHKLRRDEKLWIYGGYCLSKSRFLEESVNWYVPDEPNCNDHYGTDVSLDKLIKVQFDFIFEGKDVIFMPRSGELDVPTEFEMIVRYKIPTDNLTIIRKPKE
ncbi:hypothetical protein CEE44_05320 [Candidatus Woesearchaeota archaeon B3_Woes]|nr:MAG: hypothetical protein CEE44_05320 [Candidatus Woesearchaeota archaeon B3_Woes]